MSRRSCLWLGATVLVALTTVGARAADEPVFLVGSAERDITPPPGLPMWGYGARHDALAEGALDPLMAKAVVIAAGHEKLAIVGIDLGRAPTRAMMQTIRKEVADKAGIRHVMIGGSHTHHGPVIELTDEPGFGRGKFAAAVAYAQSLPGCLVETILDADRDLKRAKIGVSSKAVSLNRNRQSKRLPQPTDPMLAVIRFDDEEGRPIAVLVNFAAHPVLTDSKILKYSADYPGFLRKKVESTLSTRCVFMQGAAGDMSANPVDGRREPQAYGEHLADHVLELARGTTTETPQHPRIAGTVDTYRFRNRVDLANPLVAIAYERAFFPELMRTFARDFAQGLEAELDTVLLNGEIALVGASGEFFCNHAVRLRERCYLKQTLFFGYCNGYSMYFPTIEAAFEGGYGADPWVSFAELGAGEQMMNKALLNIYRLHGKFASER
jgi:neutral ceramidase